MQAQQQHQQLFALKIAEVSKDHYFVSKELVYFPRNVSKCREIRSNICLKAYQGNRTCF